MERVIETEDGTRVAYSTEGAAGAGVDLVLTNGLTSSCLFWDRLRPVWARQHRVVTWDLPGHGRSGPAASERSATVEGLPAIVAQVMDDAGVERAVQVGWSTGSQVMFEVYRQLPRRCLGLVSLLGGAGHVLDTAQLPVPGQVIDWLARHAPKRLFQGAASALTRASDNRAGHFLGRRLGLLGPRTGEADAAAITAHLRGVDVPTVQAMLRSVQRHSAHDLLDKLEVPLLIVAGDADPFAPADAVGIPMHRAAVGSELARLADGTHTAMLDHAAEIAALVESFLVRRCAQ